MDNGYNYSNMLTVYLNLTWSTVCLNDVYIVIEKHVHTYFIYLSLIMILKLPTLLYAASHLTTPPSSIVWISA